MRDGWARSTDVERVDKFLTRRGDTREKRCNGQKLLCSEATLLRSYSAQKLLCSLTGPNIHPLLCTLWLPPQELEAWIGRSCCAPPCQLHRHSLAYLRLFCRRSMGTLQSMLPSTCTTLERNHLPHRKHEEPLPRKSHGLVTSTRSHVTV